MNHAQLAERRAQALRDYEDVARQLEEGELDVDTADRLQTAYRAEAAAIEAQLAQPPETRRAEGRSPRRVLVGTVIMAVAIAGIVFAVSRAIEDRPAGGFVSGNLDQSRNLAEVSNEELEEVVAANPEVIGMRLALANRYVEARDYSAALPHYLGVLEREPDNPEALARLGWITYLSDLGEDADETAARLLERSLAAAPGYPDALFFLANVRLYGLGDPAGATELLDELLASDGVPAELVPVLENMLADAAGAGE